MSWGTLELKDSKEYADSRHRKHIHTLLTALLLSLSLCLRRIDVLRFHVLEFQVVMEDVTAHDFGPAFLFSLWLSLLLLNENICSMIPLGQSKVLDGRCKKDEKWTHLWTH